MVTYNAAAVKTSTSQVIAGIADSLYGSSSNTWEPALTTRVDYFRVSRPVEGEARDMPKNTDSSPVDQARSWGFAAPDHCELERSPARSSKHNAPPAADNALSLPSTPATVHPVPKDNASGGGTPAPGNHGHPHRLICGDGGSLVFRPPTSQGEPSRPGPAPRRVGRQRKGRPGRVNRAAKRGERPGQRHGGVPLACH
jgi:hypothetical protein